MDNTEQPVQEIGFRDYLFIVLGYVATGLGYLIVSIRVIPMLVRGFFSLFQKNPYKE